MNRRTHHKLPDLSKPPKPGHIFIDVCSGVAGPCLTVGDHCGGYRIAGPKPWGGGSTTHRFQVKFDELREQLAHYEAREEKANDD